MLAVLRSWSAEWRPIAVRLLAYMGAIAGLALLATAFFRTPGVSAAMEPPPPPAWLTVDKPHPAFHLTFPDGDAEPVYAIHRHARGGGRRDSIAIGEPGRSDRAIMIEVYRPGAELDSFAQASAEIAARTDDFHRVGPVRPLPPIETKFGSVALFDFAIRPQQQTGRCAGFVRTYDTPRLQIAGFYCVAQDFQIDRAQIACALDRFTLLAAGSDPKVGALFARAELKRTFCGQRNPLLAATPKRPVPQHPPAVKLRGRIAGN